jgi:hypothetical protein
MIVRFEALPYHIHGFVSRKVEPDGEYDVIVLNSRDSKEVQEQTYEHELKHIEYGHFDDPRPLATLEREAEYGR